MTEDKRIEYGYKLRSMRLAAGITQEALGLACGFTGLTAQRIVQHWEHGRQLPGIDKLRPLATALQVPLNQVVP
jgi:transcriptional regulator with XRE-family HTH domain